MRYNDTKWWGGLGWGRDQVVIMLVCWSWRIHCSSITLPSSGSLINKDIPASYIRNCQPKLAQCQHDGTAESHRRCVCLDKGKFPVDRPCQLTIFILFFKQSISSIRQTNKDISKDTLVLVRGIQSREKIVFPMLVKNRKKSFQRFHYSTVFLCNLLWKYSLLWVKN